MIPRKPRLRAVVVAVKDSWGTVYHRAAVLQGDRVLYVNAQDFTTREAAKSHAQRKRAELAKQQWTIWSGT